MRGNLFANKEYAFRNYSEEKIAQIAVDSFHNLFERAVYRGISDEGGIFIILTPIRLGVGHDGMLSSKEKKLMRKMLAAIPDEMVDKLCGILEGLTLEAAFAIVEPVAASMEFAPHMLNIIFCFAHIDGRFNDNVANKLEGMFGLCLMGEFFNSDDEDVPPQRATVEVSDLQMKIIKWLKTDNMMYPLADIQKHFSSESPTAVKNAMQDLEKKGIVYGGERFINNMYGLDDVDNIDFVVKNSSISSSRTSATSTQSTSTAKKSDQTKTKANNTTSNGQISNEELEKKLLAILSDGEKYTIKNMTEADRTISNLSNQRIGAALNRMVGRGDVVKQETSGGNLYTGGNNLYCSVKDAYKKYVAEFSKEGSVPTYRRLMFNFQYLGDYKDSKEYVKKCCDKINVIKYDRAVTRMSRANSVDEFKETEKMFNELGEYRDAAELAKKCREKGEQNPDANHSAPATTSNSQENTKAVASPKSEKSSVKKDSSKKSTTTKLQTTPLETTQFKQQERKYNTDSLIRNALYDVRKAHRNAMSTFQSAKRDIEWKASRGINVYYDDVTKIVGEIVNETMTAGATLVEECQRLVRLLDTTCRPLSEQCESVDLIQDVADEIASLNDDSDVNLDFTGTFEGIMLDNSCNVNFSPSDESLNIQRHWKFKASYIKKKREDEAFIRLYNIAPSDVDNHKKYVDAKNLFEKANTSAQFKEAKKAFDNISFYLDSKQYIQKCNDTISVVEKKEKEAKEEKRKQSVYDEAVKKMSSNNISVLNQAVKDLKGLAGWKDANAQIDKFQTRIATVTAEIERQRLEEEKRRKKRKKKIIIAISSIICIIIAIVLIVNISTRVKMKPLSDAVENGTLSGKVVIDNFPNPQNSKIVLKFFEKELEKCHKDGDLSRALELIQIMSDANIAFEEYMPNGNTKYKYAIAAERSFVQWMYDEAKKNGTKITTEELYLADCTYQVNNTKITFACVLDTEEAFMAYVYLSSVGWYEIGSCHDAYAPVN